MYSFLLKTFSKFLFILLFFLGQQLIGQISITSLPYTKTDNFNSYNPTSAANATSTIPAGWSYSGPPNFRNRGTGTGNQGGFYGLGTGTDFSLGALRTGSDTYNYSVSFINNTGSTITSLTIAWNYEQWRYANTSGWNVTGTGQLASNATLNAKNFNGVTSGTNGSVSTTAVASFTLTGLAIANGQSFGINWATTDAVGADNAVSIDDFSLTASSAPAAPTVTTTSNTGLIDATEAFLTGTINANGTTTDASFEYGTSVAYGNTITASPSTVTGTTTTDIDAFVSSLSPNTLYHYRAVGTLSAVPTNGDDLTFYTLAVTPGVLAISNPQFTTLDIAIDATTENGNPAATEYAIQETGGQYVQGDGSLGATAVWQTAAAWGTTAVTGLTASTTYTFQVKARNGENVETTFGTTNSGTTLSPQTADYNVVQFPNTTQNITEGTSFTVYIRAYEDGITNLGGSSPRLKGWVGYSQTNDNPANVGWTWIPATFNVQVGNDDEYQADIPGTLTPGTYYYAARFEIDDSMVYTYGGSGGNWNNDNVTLNVNADVVDFANIQFPTTATLTEGNTVTVFAQVFEPGVTPGAGAGAGITAQIGYSASNTTPDGTWTWLATTYNTDSGNNDEYQADLGAGLAPGTYYYASRFIKSGSSTYVYGGTNGSPWATSGVLTVNALGTPTATAGTSVGLTSFTANWDAVTDATSYEIDVYEETTVVATNLIISEYGEGSTGSKKYIEIFNGTGTSVDLANYEIWLVSNGGTWPESTISLTGTLANGGTYVIANNATDVIGADLYSGSLSFNGDDAVGLAWNGGSGITYSLIDAVGEDGSDPGAGWSVAGTTLATVDKILIRKSNVSSPTTDWAASAGTTVEDSQWEVSSFTYSNTGDTTDLGSHTFSGGAATTYVVNAMNVGAVTSYEVTGLDPETTYHYRVRAVLGAVTSPNSNVIDVTTADGTCTWNGSTWSNTTGPTFEINAIVTGAYDTATEGGFTAKTVTVSTGGSLLIGADTSVTVVNELINELSAAEVVISNDGSLIQEGTTNNNSGNITVVRNSQNLMRLDYTMWSSPVAVQNLATFSPSTLANRFYTYTTATDIYTAIDNTNDFAVGQGYLIRTPNDHPTSPSSWLGQFIGFPNSGDIPVTLSIAGNGYNLVGNPYPSPISISTLLSENSTVIAGNLYFWRKTNGAAGSAYISYSGGTFSDGAHTFDNIQPGQGFIVEATSASNLTFTNTQRQPGNGVFYRNANTTLSENNSRIWLNLSTNNTVVGQMAIGYNATASNDIDDSDAAYINDSAVALNSFVANTELAVQHRAAFEPTDVVPLSFKTNTAGSYTISINNLDGLFENDAQTIFMKDNLLNIEQDLRSAPYVFTSDAGSFTNRFEIVYQSTLSVANPNFENGVVVFSKNKVIEINSGLDAMASVRVVDIRGSVIVESTTVNANTLSIPLTQVANQVLIVQITGIGGQTISKKVVH